MRLVASVIVRNELGRYLEPCVGHLLEFCDEVRVLDNNSDDGWQDVVRDDRLHALRYPDVSAQDASLFVGHAGARQRLLEWTLEAEPTHILAVDADEFIADGAAIRAACAEPQFGAWHVCLQEVWNVHDDRLDLRQDGGWVEHEVSLLWRPGRVSPPYRIIDRGPATGRTPDNVRRAATGHTCTALLHLGWTNRSERVSRHERYVVADGGRFHASAHLDSILWPDERVELTGRDWPASLDGYRARILESARADR